jgi:hypothetical protein
MVVGVVLAVLTSHIAQAVLCDVDWFQGVWVQDWVQPKWIVRRGNPLHVCPRSQRPPVSQLKWTYRETTEAAMTHPTSKRKQPKWVLSLCREMQASIGLQLRTECELPKELAPDLSALVARLDREAVGTC